jgi:hypothetical protein
MKHPIRLQHLLQKPPAKQRTLDLGNTSPWTQLSAADRQACRDAIAALLFQVATATSFHDEHRLQENDEHER